MAIWTKPGWMVGLGVVGSEVVVTLEEVVIAEVEVTVKVSDNNWDVTDTFKVSLIDVFNNAVDVGIVNVFPVVFVEVDTMLLDSTGVIFVAVVDTELMSVEFVEVIVEGVWDTSEEDLLLLTEPVVCSDEVEPVVCSDKVEVKLIIAVLFVNCVDEIETIVSEELALAFTEELMVTVSVVLEVDKFVVLGTLTSVEVL